MKTMEETYVPGAAAGSDAPMFTDAELLESGSKHGPKPIEPAEGEMAQGFRLPGTLPELNAAMSREQIEAAAINAFGEATVNHERARGPKAALAVGCIAKLLVDYKITYAKVSELLAGGVADTEPVAPTYEIHPDDARVQGQVMDDALAAKLGVPRDIGIVRVNVPKPNRVRQNATQYIFLARVYAGLREEKKGDKPFPASVTINGVTYANPVEALLDSCSFRSVHTSYYNLIRPKVVNLVSIRDKDAAETAAREQAGDPKTCPTAVVRVFDEEKGGYQKKKVKAVESAPVMRGIIHGMLKAAKWEWSEKQVRATVKRMGWTIEGNLVPATGGDEAA